MKSIVATAGNTFFGLGEDDELESIIELVVHASEPRGEYAGRKFSSVDTLETLRFVASADGLRHIAKQLVEYADAADAMLEKIKSQ